MSNILFIFNTEYDQAKVPPYNGNDPPPAPGSLKALLLPPLLNNVENKGTQGVRARYGAELPPFVSIVWCPGRPVILGMEFLPCMWTAGVTSLSLISFFRASGVLGGQHFFKRQGIFSLFSRAPLRLEVTLRRCGAQGAEARALLQPWARMPSYTVFAVRLNWAYSKRSISGYFQGLLCRPPKKSLKKPFVRPFWDFGRGGPGDSCK